MAKKKEKLKKKINIKPSNKKQNMSKSSTKSRKKTISKQRNNVNKIIVNKNDNVEQKKEQITQKTNKKIVKKSITLKNNNLKNRLIEIFKYINKTKKVWMLSLVITLLAGLIIIFLGRNTKKVFLSFKSYSAGDEVILNDNSKWYVIEESSSDEILVKLLSANILDINNDGKLDEKDKIAFDSSGAYEYNTKNDKNIGYFLEHKIKDKFDKLSGIKELRLLSSDEYIHIRNSMEFGYDWNEGNWLANSELDLWWLETSKYNKIYVVTERGSYRLAKSTSKYFVRPVIIIEKENIKNT